MNADVRVKYFTSHILKKNMKRYFHNISLKN